MHIEEMTSDQLHREIARLEQRSTDIEHSIYDAQEALRAVLDRQAEAIARLQALREDARPFDPRRPLTSEVR